jgi:glycosyltransferase involved in cell wall biosynthesis
VASDRRPGRARVLYLTYDGLTDPLGRSQVLPYLVELSRLGHQFAIVSCEKPALFAAGRGAVERICAEAEIAWHPLPYHKFPPILSTVWDLGAIARKAAELRRIAAFDLVHCRSFLAAIPGHAMKRKSGTRFLYDMRAFWADERVDAGQWRIDRFPYREVYRFVTRRESRFFREADHIVSLTEAGRQVMLARPEFAASGPPISVIPCCVDFDHFVPASPQGRALARAQLGIAEDEKVVAVLGSVGGLTMLEEMLDFFRVYRQREPRARLLMITTSAPGPILDAARGRGVEPERLTIRSASREEVPVFTAAADFGLFFVRPVPSKKAGSPTKMGEMFALGLPIVTNAGVGDVEELCAELKAGAVVRDFTESAYDAAIDALAAMPHDPAGISERARARLDLSVAVAEYDRIYQSLLGVSVA